MSIPDIREFIKTSASGERKDVVVLAIIVLSASGAFALGRLSALESGSVSVEQEAAVHDAIASQEKVISSPVDTKNSQEVTGGQVVASKTGSKYHFPWCAGARSIKESNKIYFASIEAARAAGYTPAANCKGLP